MGMKISRGFVEEVQNLLDEGYSMNKVAEILGVYHRKITRMRDKGLIEFYNAFDEEIEKVHLYQNFEWLWEEDKLEEILWGAFDGKIIIEKNYNDDSIAVGNYARDNYGGIEKYFLKKGFAEVLENVYVMCPTCNEASNISYWRKDRRRAYGLSHECNICKSLVMRRYYKNHPEKLFENNYRRREIAEALPGSKLNKKEWYLMRNYYKWRCALSLLSEAITIDHFIPVVLGHGGTYPANLIPLTKSVNSSKKDSHPYQWFEANRQRFELSQGNFDKVIDYLASANALTVDEYRSFVDWCFANPRTVDEVRADQRHSIEIWREESGQQFPLPKYVKEVPTKS